MNPAREPPRDAARAIGFTILAVGVAVWWALILHVPVTRSWFFPGGVVAHAFRSFVMPDLLILSLGSAIAAWRLWTGRPAVAVAWFSAGATCYAALYTISWALHEDVPRASPLLMAAAAVLSLLCARRPVSRSR